MIVIQVTNEQNSDGVFDPASLKNIDELTEFALKLRWDDPTSPKNQTGVVREAVLAPSTVDRIGSGGPGVITFEWLLTEQTPQTREAALSIRDAALDHPLLNGTVVSSDGRSVYIWLPATDKEICSRIQKTLEQKTQEFNGPERYDMTGILVGAIRQDHLVSGEEATDTASGPSVAYLVLGPAKDQMASKPYIDDLRIRLSEMSVEWKDDFPNVTDVVPEVEEKLLQKASEAKTEQTYLEELIDFANKKVDTVDEKEADLWYEFVDFFEREAQRLKLFKRPEMLRYLSALQRHLQSAGRVSKSDSVADLVKKIHQELIDGRPQNFIVPDTPTAVAQCLLQFQASHTPDALWHFVTPDYGKANIRMQLSGSSTKDTKPLVETILTFMEENPPPVSLEAAVLIPCLTWNPTSGLPQNE